MIRALALAIALLLAGCGERIDPAPVAGDVHQLPQIEWRIVGAPELRRVYADAGMPLAAGDKLHGFVGEQSGRVVIYTLPPRRVDDQPTCTLGHELLHVAIGDYHR